MHRGLATEPFPQVRAVSRPRAPNLKQLWRGVPTTKCPAARRAQHNPRLAGICVFAGFLAPVVSHAHPGRELGHPPAAPALVLSLFSPEVGGSPRHRHTHMFALTTHVHTHTYTQHTYVCTHMHTYNAHSHSHTYTHSTHACTHHTLSQSHTRPHHTVPPGDTCPCLSHAEQGARAGGEMPDSE